MTYSTTADTPNADPGVVKPSYCRNQPWDPSDYQLSHGQLRSLKRKIDMDAAAPEVLKFAIDHHEMTVIGLEYFPHHDPVIFACNHTGTPVLAGNSLMLETVLLVAHTIHRYQLRVPRPLMSIGYYSSATTFRLNRELLEKLGCVPMTLDNGIRLLDRGEDVLIYPEGEDSLPPYQTRPFFWGFAKMAWTANVSIVPVALIGPHESRLRIDRPDIPIIFVAPGRRPNPVPYKLTFLPPVNVRDYVRDIRDRDSLSAFCERVRQSIQQTLDKNSVNRSFISVAKRLQTLHGSP